MVSGFGDLGTGTRLSGVVADGNVTIVVVETHESGSVTLTYRTADEQLGERIVFTVVSVHDDPHIEPEVHYLVDPFQDMGTHQAQTTWIVPRR